MAVITCNGTSEISYSPIMQIWKLVPREGKHFPDDVHQARRSVAFILVPAWGPIWQLEADATKRWPEPWPQRVAEGSDGPH